ncbi:hypothetical protein EGI31_03425 [Lacihabitans soyangensis]|uniref:DUF3592 domain-containing protein n=1 Tax=Lacihabitans soyangensis TaxID=869394 RepID=A0AAE3KT81_9BACT|nr:hypothetical protein [Lacihabitans soyangensis]
MVFKKESFIRIFWILVILIGIWLIFIRPEIHIYKLKNNGQKTKGLIYRKSGVGSKGTSRCFYNFVVNGKVYEGFYDNTNLNQNDSIVIIYYLKNPNLNQAKQFVDDY